MTDTTPISLSTSPPVTAYIGIGSNLGDRAAHINTALSILDQSVSVTAVSSIIETAPVGGPAGQCDYLNAAAAVASRLSAVELFEFLRAIEIRLGRVRLGKWCPRTIDLDLLLFGDCIIDCRIPDLQVPHRLMHDRLFVMIPLAEIAAEVVHPVSGLSIGGILARLLSQSQTGYPLTGVSAVSRQE